MMKLIVGLGNPDKSYSLTRHNIGFIIVDNYLQEVDWKEKFLGLYYICTINNEKVVFLKPSTYMNLSGSSVAACAKYFKIKSEDILVIHDDLDMDFGKIRLKKMSSSGGHNGIKSIINSLNTDLFCRFKFGISKNQNVLTKDYVLSKFSREEQKYIREHQGKYNNIINSFIIYGIEKTMNDYNGS